MKLFYFTLLTLLITLSLSPSVYAQSAMELRRKLPADFDLSSYEYRRPKPLPKLPKELKDKLEVSDTERNEYKEITKTSKGKIAKIWNYPCEAEKVIDARDSFCVSQLEFAPGSSYIFPQLVSYYKVTAGIDTIKGEFRAKGSGKVIQLLADIGEVDLSLINTKTEAVESLNRLPMFGDKNAVDLTGLAEGRRFEKLIIRDRRPIAANHTYLLRTMELTEGRNDYWRLESTYAFRVVKFENNIVTFVWKELQSKSKHLKAPKAN